MKEVPPCMQNSGCGNCVVPLRVAHMGSVVKCGVHMFRWAPLGCSYSSCVVTLNRGGAGFCAQRRADSERLSIPKSNAESTHTGDG